jgi:hypothetical protein
VRRTARGGEEMLKERKREEGCERRNERER